MSLVRILLLCVALLLSTVAFAAPAQAGVDCRDVQTCPIVIVDEERVCAGVLIGTQGVGSCVWALEGCIGTGGGFTNYKWCPGVLP